MDQLQASLTAENQKSFIKCHVLLETPASEVYNIAKSKVLLRSTVYSVFQEFQSGKRTSVEGKAGSGRQRTKMTHHNKERLRELLLEDNDLMINEMIGNR
jgi:hypothetical protein